MYAGPGCNSQLLHQIRGFMQFSTRIPRMPMNPSYEADVLTDARKYYCYTSRPGVCKKIKRGYNKRERKWIKQNFGVELGSTGIE
jgi:hypothetical protein